MADEEEAPPPRQVHRVEVDSAGEYSYCTAVQNLLSLS